MNVDSSSAKNKIETSQPYYYLEHRVWKELDVGELLTCIVYLI